MRKKEKDFIYYNFTFSCSSAQILDDSIVSSNLVKLSFGLTFIGFLKLFQ